MKKSILIIDDEYDFHIILRRILEPAGYKIISAMSAEEALRMLEAFVPSLALVDWNLPGISGVEFVKKIRQGRKFDKMLLVMFTVRDLESDHLAAYAGRADFYLTKPVNPEIMLEKINKLLNQGQYI